MKKLYAFCLLLLSFSACNNAVKESKEVLSDAERIDYSDTTFWYSFGDTLKQADVFYVYPTVCTDSYADNDSSWYADILSADVRVVANENQRFNKMLYDDYNFYAPYYRQLIFEAYNQSEEAIMECSQLPASDVKAAFQYYMENCNNGRPFFLMGHSQGSQMLVELLKDGMTDEQRRLMVAAYCIGWKITQEELDLYPDRLVPASDSCTTGTIVIFNSIAELAGVSPMFANTAVGINPLSWSTDTCFISKEAHLGMAKYNDDHDSILLIPAFTGGRLVDGMMLCADVDPMMVYVPAYEQLFPKGNLHFADSWMFAGNVKQNMACRLRNFAGQRDL